MIDHPDEVRQLQKTTRELAELGGRIARPFLGRASVSRKSDKTPVTDADLAVQDALLTVLAERHPDHSVLVEERVARPDLHAALGESDYCWSIDPIDGTRNFSRGLGVYATSVAVLHCGRPIAGAIHDATSDRVFSAGLGLGAWCGDQPSRLPPGLNEADATVAVSSFRQRPVPPAVKAWQDRYLLRNAGSVCLHLVWVATGMTDAAFAVESRLWDIAAGALIITEAGGVATTDQGRELWPINPATYERTDLPILVGHPILHKRLLDSLLEHE